MYYKTKNILIDNKLVAKIFFYQKKKFSGIKFFTKNNLPFQVGLMSHAKNHVINSHLHIEHKKTIKNMSEFLIIFKGSLKVFFYNKKKLLIKTNILKKKDMILLLTGAHGFQVIKPLEMLEIKQGPFRGDRYKKRLKRD